MRTNSASRPDRARRAGVHWRLADYGQFFVRWLLPLSFVLVAWLAYFNAIPTPFVFDDLESIVENHSLADYSWQRIWREQRGFGY